MFWPAVWANASVGKAMAQAIARFKICFAFLVISVVLPLNSACLRSMLTVKWDAPISLPDTAINERLLFSGPVLLPGDSGPTASPMNRRPASRTLSCSHAGDFQTACGSIYFSGNVARFLRRQQYIEWRHLNGLTRPFHRSFRAKLRDLLVWLSSTGLKRSPDWSWSYAIDADALLGHLSRERTCERKNGCFRWGIVQKTGARVCRLDRCSGDNGTARRHERQSDLTHPEQREYIDAVGFLKLLRRQVFYFIDRMLLARNARQNIETTELLMRGFDDFSGETFVS